MLTLGVFSPFHGRFQVKRARLTAVGPQEPEYRGRAHKHVFFPGWPTGTPIVPYPYPNVEEVCSYLDCAQRQRPWGRTSLLRMGPLGSSGQPWSRTSHLGMAGSPPEMWPQGWAGKSLQIHIP